MNPYSFTRDSQQLQSHGVTSEPGTDRRSVWEIMVRTMEGLAMSTFKAAIVIPLLAVPLALTAQTPARTTAPLQGGMRAHRRNVLDWAGG